MTDKKNKEENEPRLTPPSEKKESEIKSEKKNDYLRKYEYHQPTGRPYFQLSSAIYSPPPKGSKAEIMKNVLLSQKRVTVFIPRKEAESDQILQTVNLNGYHLELPKQTYLELPEQIVDLLKDSLKQDEEALRSFRIDTRDKENALL